MSFRAYMRWDGWLGMVVGISLVAIGLAQGHQGAVDAAQSGAMLIAGTGVFMRVRHKVPLREPASWFTSPPLAAAGVERAACGRRRVAGRPLRGLVELTEQERIERTR